jgi:hypothetical protein
MRTRANGPIAETHIRFLDDINLMVANAMQFNQDVIDDGEAHTKTMRVFSKRIRRAATSLRDDANHLIENAEAEHSDLLKECEGIAESRDQRKVAEAAVNPPASPEKTQPEPELAADSVDFDIGEEAPMDQSILGKAPVDSIGEAGPAVVIDERSGAAQTYGASLAESMSAAEAAAQPAKKLTNVDRLDGVLSEIVAHTKGWTLAELTELLSRLRHLQYAHRENCDKGVVANAMRNAL